MTRRPLFFALLLLALTGLPVTAVHALDPGCSPDVMKLLQSQADAIRARNRAYAMETLQRDNSTLYLTCFDQTMALGSRLGLIFSDRAPADARPANTVVWTGDILYPDWGLKHLLAVDLNTVVTPALDNQLKNFNPDPVVPNVLTNLVKNTLQPFLDQIQVFLEAEKQSPVVPPATISVTEVIEAYKYIESVVNSYPSVTFAELPEKLLQYTGAGVAFGVYGPENVALKSRQPYLQPILDKIKDALLNTKYSACTRLDDLWNDPGDKVTTTHYYPPEGKYYALSPYFSLQEILDVPASPPATAEFVKELNNATDSAILSQALADLTGPLSKPGNGNPVWPAAPTIPAIYGTKDVIEAMKQP